MAATDDDGCLDDKCANAEDEAPGRASSASQHAEELSESEEDEEEEDEEELADEEELLEDFDLDSDLDLVGLITTAAAGLISCGGSAGGLLIPLFSSSCGILLALLLMTFNFFLIMSIPS